MSRERARSRRCRRIAVLGVGILGAGILLATAPATAQESEREIVERQLQEAQARAEAVIRERQVRAEEEMARAEARRRGELELALEAAQAPHGHVRVGGPGGLFVESLGGPSAASILARAEELELDDQQIERIRAAERDHRRAEIERDAAIEVAELDLEELMTAGDSPDLQAVEAKMMDIAALRVQARIAGLRLRQDVEAVLTAEQRAELDEMGHGYLFRTRSNPPGSYLFRRDRDGERWKSMLDERLRDGLGERMWLERLEPLRDLRWFHFDRDHDHDDDEEEESDDEGQAGVVGR